MKKLGRPVGLLLVAAVIGFAVSINHIGASSAAPQQPATTQSAAMTVSHMASIESRSNVEVTVTNFTSLKEVEKFKLGKHYYAGCPHKACGGIRYDENPAQLQYIKPPSGITFNGGTLTYEWHYKKPGDTITYVDFNGKTAKEHIKYGGKQFDLMKLDGFYTKS